MNQVANLLPAEFSVGAVTRRRARTRVSFHFADGLIAMVLLAATLICYSYYQQMQTKLALARAEHARVETEAAALELENARIAAEVEALHNDPIVIENVARQELGMVRSGEMVLTLASTIDARH